MIEWGKNTSATVGRHSDLQNPMWLHDSIHTRYRKMKIDWVRKGVTEQKKHMLTERATESKDSTIRN